MDEIARKIVSILQGKTKFELEIARGIFYSVLFPRQQSGKQLYFAIDQWMPTLVRRRQFTEVINYTPRPLIVGGWDDDHWFWD